MFTTVLTWAGAMLGITVLAVMAFGAIAIDFDSARAAEPKDVRTPH